MLLRDHFDHFYFPKWLLVDLVAPVIWTTPMVDAEVGVGVGATPAVPRSRLALILDGSTLIAEDVVAVGAWGGVVGGDEAAGLDPPAVGVVGLDVVWKLRELWEGESNVGSEPMVLVVTVCVMDEEDLETPMWENGAREIG